MKTKSFILKRITAIITIIILVLTLSSCEKYSGLTINYLDVGMGDSEFIELPNGQTMLIDASISSQGNKICDYISKNGYKKIDYLVATHPHADHIGGIKKVLDKFDVGEVILPNAPGDSSTYEKMLDTINSKNYKVIEAKNGVEIFNFDDCRARILSPDGVSDYNNLNNYSVVIMLSFKNKKFLFMGDAEKQIEKTLLDNSEDLKADVLKVAHHGSDTSSSTDFINAVSPEYSIISVGKDNKYGDPNESVLNTLTDKGTKLMRTDLNGTIIVKSDGENIDVSAEKIK